MKQDYLVFWSELANIAIYIVLQSFLIVPIFLFPQRFCTFLS